MPRPSARPSARPAAAVLAAATLVALGAVLAACAPESDGGAVPTTTATATAPTPSTQSPSPDAGMRTALPADCAGAYSADTSARLQQQDLPLNDPGITLLSTQQAPLLEILGDSATLHCTWGRPGSAGLSTNLTVVDPDEAEQIVQVLSEAGFGCEDDDGATTCAIEQRGVSLDDVEYVRGETHAVRGDLWVATSWVNVDISGYSDDILATLQD